MSQPNAYKPSPLSIGSPRTSPFRRPTTPTSPTAALRPSTPTRQTSPSKLQTASTPPTATTPEAWKPRGLTPTLSREAPPSPTPTTTSNNTTIPALPQSRFSQTPSSLPPNHPLLPRLHSAFHHLDRTSSGSITRTDIAETLTSLSLPANPSDISPFFPPGAPQTLALPNFLSTLSGLLAPLSSQEELLNAFAAFDERDSGEVDVAELRDAVANTGGKGGLGAAEVDRVLDGYVGRKALGKGWEGGGRREVFRYREWVGGVLGSGEKGE